MNNYVEIESRAPQDCAQPPPEDNKIISNNVLTLFNKDDSPNTKRGKCNRCGSDEHWEVTKCPEYRKYRYLADKYLKLEYEATKKLIVDATFAEGTAPETRNIHSTLGIEDDYFDGEDQYIIAFLNLVS